MEREQLEQVQASMAVVASMGLTVVHREIFRDTQPELNMREMNERDRAELALLQEDFALAWVGGKALTFINEEEAAILPVERTPAMTFDRICGRFHVTWYTISSFPEFMVFVPRAHNALGELAVKGFAELDANQKTLIAGPLAHYLERLSGRIPGSIASSSETVRYNSL